MVPKLAVLTNFRALDVDERRRALALAARVDVDDVRAAFAEGGIDAGIADKMVENAVGLFGLPVGIALNVQVNGKDYIVPMATEEPSVIAAASHAAKRVRAAGGFQATMDDPLMVAQVEVHDVADPAGAAARVREAWPELRAMADAASPGLVERGGGARDLTIRDLGDGFVVVHILVDCRDAMGANLLNTIAEAVGDRVAELVGGELGLRILSNYCDQRVARIVATIPVDDFGCGRVSGREAARGVVNASRFAERDSYRAVTHNKGIMNGVDAVVIATGNDFRAVEAGAHAFAARAGRYAPLATWRLCDDDRMLEGRLEIPLALGIVGGASRAHRAARLALKILGVSSASELSMVAAAVGLATNLSALRALATEGIQRGHMALHVRASSIPGRPGLPTDNTRGTLPLHDDTAGSLLPDVPSSDPT